MDKDNRYWSTHKQVYNNFLNELDKEIVEKIYKNPDCVEALLLNSKVDKEIEQQLNQESTA